MKNIKKQTVAFAFSLLIFSILTFSFTRQQKKTTAQGQTDKCLIVSDIHFNPLYGASLKDTVLKRKLEGLTFDGWKKYFEGSAAHMTMNATLLFQDANYAVLRSALYNMKKRLPNPAFIVIAGDFIWHGATPADSILKKKTILFITRLFKENFPNTLIVPAMGNNDTYGNDYALQDPKFLKDFATAWEPNLPSSSGDVLKAQGYYTYETGNLEFIVLNTALLNAGTKYPQAADMLKWLHDNLASANGKNIWIVMHIPPGLNSYNDKNFWNAEYTKAFVQDIVKYAPEVKFIIASHTHFNDFRVIYSAGNQAKPVSFMRIVPSICSNHGNYPSFEVAEFNTSTNRVISETNWYLNLAAVPKDKSPERVIWADTLSLPSSLKLNKIDAASFSKLIQDIKTDKTGQLLNRYIKFYSVGIDSPLTFSRKSYMKYLKADSLEE